MNEVSPVRDLTTLMGNFWSLKYSTYDSQDQENGLEEERRRVLHLTHYILQVNEFSTFKSIHHYELESLLALKTWTNLNRLCKMIVHSPFSSLNDSDASSFLMGNGLCAGAVTHHFSCFFKTFSFAESVFAFGATLSVDQKDGVEFRPFKLEKEVLHTDFRSLRFLQGVYKVLQAKKSTEFISRIVLSHYQLKLVRRIPSLKVGKKSFFEIEELILQLGKHNHLNSAFLLGISNTRKSHALGVCMNAPYHFVDPNYGIGMAENRHDLLLFLSSFLIEKYRSYKSFALLEFTSTLFE